MSFPAFTFGQISMALAVLFPLIYLAGHLLRCLGAWFNRAEAPKNRVIAYMAASVVMGLVLGGLIQPMWDDLRACRAAGYPLGQCLIDPLHIKALSSPQEQTEHDFLLPRTI